MPVRICEGAPKIVFLTLRRGVIDQVFYEPNTRRPVGALEAVLTATLSSRVGLQVAVRDVVFVSRVYRPGSTDALSDEVLHRASLVLGVSLIL